MSVSDFNWLAGQHVEALSLTEPVSWSFKFSDRTWLGAETLWRVVSSERVEVTSDDHGHQFGLPEPVDAGARAIQVLGRAKVRRAYLVKPAGDVVFEFDNGEIGNSHYINGLRRLVNDLAWTRSDHWARWRSGRSPAADLIQTILAAFALFAVKGRDRCSR